MKFPIGFLHIEIYTALRGFLATARLLFTCENVTVNDIATRVWRETPSERSKKYWHDDDDNYDVMMVMNNNNNNNNNNNDNNRPNNGSNISVLACVY